MRFIAAAVVAVLPVLSSAHTIAQEVRVNGKAFGVGNGIRVATLNAPISGVNNGNIACNTGYQTPVSAQVIDVNVGDKVGVHWAPAIGGQPGSVDYPIQPSHKGPVLFYMAKVDSAATAQPSGQTWFKVFEDGFTNSTGQWAVDRLIAADGWQDFSVPSCIASGEYLLRAEIIALHNNNDPQFFMGCAQIKVSGGSGSASPKTVSFPGAYAQSDPGVNLVIYGKDSKPTMDGNGYTVPGPPLLQC
ncbi:glycoside hydrolase family 61 protein-like protein [Massariosphaeria phaeospora]|uniref:AA9 family lytic polysaccharide monooxygenase n=1 Tax=Massariosphaeria phaeospora TaxID=100035 RepID=A0A7C8IA23_9PLEO|nr:glycoside hydrolase family 61 protein-like protein [Massariosphaeria phaeospora]